ncbi:iron transport protein-binding protein [Saccharopolyspora erythraea NRRL 2338]|uniref:Iron transport protein-binding protein n=1 Tax=Saccharopolyspora erythraea (strain ATCC 11635 / DSM 40517 / JCM 4748 / NBRC 13426 / NCIMB 8594 / NRRL 2338) TaxID=405948 RepID=A4FMC6_SACEN|nr:metal ABC transporter substrate-binding protein [Saccharopolyspora erythraea]EQD87774.1 metal ABC transporter substrate-binding protein [Saccharopolyspora erythraea D]QRK88841.1 metal ABC transporter substrate-binding protein [Saccharopolyspora erythraea]CAM05201.1 iron transport protein-binding protein [Saccharopolyspora erythraea NRRL 2338]
MAKSRASARRNTFIAVTCALALAATACGTVAGAPADDGRKHVVTTFTVIADMTRNVAGDKVAVESITKPGTEIHEYEPTPSDLLKGAKADLVLDNGLGLERWFDRFVQRSEARHVTLTSGVQPMPIRSGQYDGKANPHAWMSPRNAAVYVTNIRDALSRLDPANAATFHANADAYLRRIGEIDQYLRAELARLPGHHRALVTCEGAFSYLARDAGLREAYLWPVNSDEEGTPQQIKDTTGFVRDNQVPAVFCESTVNDKAQRQVAAETGARMGEKLYVDSLSEPGGPVPTYLDLLRHDAESIVAGLTGGAR